jgi:hypothetical protein
MEYLMYQVLAGAIFLIFPVWKIFSRAGLRPTMSLTVLIPFIGILIAGLILIFSKWNPVFGANGDDK